MVLAGSIWSGRGHPRFTIGLNINSLDTVICDLWLRMPLHVNV